MSQTYEVIKTNGERYKTVYSKYEEYFDDFYDYEISITNHIRTKSHDGRPSSYRIFVVKSLYLYQQKFGSIPATLTDIDFIDKFLSILDDSEFITLNREYHGFYQASIKEFIRYLISRDDSLAVKFNNPNFLKESKNQHTKKLVDGYVKKLQDIHPIRKRKPKYIGKSAKYPRDSFAKEYTKKIAHYKCECDLSHTTFISENDGHQYMEAHHLIPMNAQDHFENSIDFYDNMISLCPTCHRRIHLAEKEDRKHMIEHFYNLRKDKYKAHGIEITLEELLSFYDI